MVQNSSAQWAFPPDEQCVWEENWENEDGKVNEDNRIKREIVDGVTHYSCKVKSSDLTGYYGLSEGDLIKVRVKAISNVDTESQWSQNYIGAYV